VVEGKLVRFIESRPVGAAWLLRGLSERLKIDRDLHQLVPRDGGQRRGPHSGAGGFGGPLDTGAAGKYTEQCVLSFRPDETTRSVEHPGEGTREMEGEAG